MKDLRREARVHMAVRVERVCTAAETGRRHLVAFWRLWESARTFARSSRTTARMPYSER